MNGAQDMGGKHGFGPVTPEPNEPVFHGDWEKRAFALTLAMGMPGGWNIDMSRFARENRPPAEYLSMSYYQIWLAALEQMIKERDEGTRDFLLVDVREENDYEINKIPGSVLIPKGEFLNGHALEQLPSDKQIVMHCKTGVRSAEALAVVKGAGYADAIHVGGGVSAWVDQIDPSQPAY